MSEEARVKLAARLLLSILSQTGCRGDEATRRTLEALHDAGEELAAGQIVRREGPTPDDVYVSLPGVFRVVAAEHGVSLRDPYTQERWAKWVKNAIGGGPGNAAR